MVIQPLSTCLIKPNFCFDLSHRHSTTVSLETRNPFTKLHLATFNSLMIIIEEFEKCEVFHRMYLFLLGNYFLIGWNSKKKEPENVSCCILVQITCQDKSPLFSLLCILNTLSQRNVTSGKSRDLTEALIEIVKNQGSTKGNTDS